MGKIDLSRWKMIVRVILKSALNTVLVIVIAKYLRVFPHMWIVM